MDTGQPTASRVFFAVSMSLDGYVAPSGMDLEHAADPTYLDWAQRWGALQDWILPQRFFRENLGLGEGGETGPDDDLARAVHARTGVTVMGKRMFDGGEMFWPEDAPFHTPVFVVTHTERSPWERPGGTTFHFVNDGIESALAQACAVAGGRDVRIGGGADLIQQYLAAGLVDECVLSLAPVVLGGGTPLFDRIGFGTIGLEPVETISTPRATHLRFAVTRG
ncbi:dihydrofolate reductase family protein [Cellulomonas sp. McL0617]|uniref:dihydrofolate reductase family protein n=1 Tax=Cellulomonas sp. McL0617 TaxID=3415675 RepID=UPI003CF0A432